MKKEITITFNDKTTKVFPKGTTYLEVSKTYQSKMNNKIIGVKVNNEIMSMTSQINENETLCFFDVNDLTGYKMYQAGIKFVFEVALKEIRGKNSEVTFNHSVAKGMIADIKNGLPFSKDDVVKLKAKMSEIIAEDLIFEKLNVTKKDAIYYYQKINLSEKAKNAHNVPSNVVTLYKLKDYLNYYYTEMPYSTGVLDKYEIAFIEDNRLCLMYPTPRSKDSVPEYVHYGNVIRTFDKGKTWLESLNVPYLCAINDMVAESKIQDFIKASEIDYDNKIHNIVEHIARDDKIKCILIAGPSSSGKTTTTMKLSLNLLARGYEPLMISVDDYFVNRENTPKDEDGNYDFECLEAMDTKLFNEQMLELIKGNEVKTPQFNFMTGQREWTGTTKKLQSNGIILIEGLHCLNDEMTPMIPNETKYKIYLSPFIPLNLDRHNYISTTDLRMIRRMVRDNRTRGTDVSSTIGYWQSVRKGEEKNIFPFIHQADIILNTAHAYELGILRVLAEPILYSVHIDSEYYEEARRLINFLGSFYPIPSSYIAVDSVLREFVGGSYFD